MKQLIIKIAILIIVPLSLFSHEIEEKLFAVHATNFLIKDGVIKAFNSDTINLPEKFPELKELPDPIPDFRSTVHFSLGALSPAVNSGEYDWEDCKYAVIAPISELMPQVVNLNMYDTFVLGNFEFTEKTTLLLPLECMDDEAFKNTTYELAFYDSSSTTIREAIDDVIKSKEGWKIDLYQSDDGMLADAYLNGEEVNNRNFFQPLLKERPYISVGCRFWDCTCDEMEEDFGAYLFGSAEDDLQSLVEGFLPIDFDEEGHEEIDDDFDEIVDDEKNIQEFIEILEWLKQMFAEEFNALSEYVDSLPIDNKHKQVFENKIPQYVRWMNIFNADVEAMIKYRKTLENAPLDIWKQVLECNSLEELNTLIDRIHPDLPKVYG